MSAAVLVPVTVPVSLKYFLNLCGTVTTGQNQGLRSQVNELSQNQGLTSQVNELTTHVSQVRNDLKDLNVSIHEILKRSNSETSR